MSGNSITYEVQILERGRWVTEGHYGRSDREEAMAHARSLERSRNQMVKVVRETFTAADNHAEQTIVYRSEPQPPSSPPPASRKENGAAQAAPKGGAAQTAPKGGATRKAATSKPAQAKPAAPEPAASPAKPRLRSSLLTFGKAVAIVAVAMTAGFLVMYGLGQLIDIFASPTLSMNRTTILLVSNVTTVLLTALPLLLRMMAPRRPAPAPLALPDEEEVIPPVEPEAAEAPPPEPAAAPAIPPSIEPDSGESETRPETAAEDEAALAESPQEEAPPPLTPEQQFAELCAALAGALPLESGEADPQRTIGAGLLLAGAADRLRGKEASLGEQFAALLTAALDRLGTEPGFARTFLELLSASVEQPHYRSMLATGYMLIDDIAESRRGDPARIRRCLDAWTAPAEAAPAVEEQATILVSCLHPRAIAAFHEGKGEILAGHHEALLRRAIILHSGTVVSLSPEQATIRFAWPAQAIEAAIALQQAAKHRIEEKAEEPFDLAIGLDAGIVPGNSVEAMAPLIETAAAAARAAQPKEIRCTQGLFERTTSDIVTLTQVTAGGSGAAPYRISWR